MTTRKELIERIQAMQLGTQEMLDAAANDARLIPFNTLFVTNDGNVVAREESLMDDSVSVSMCGIGLHRFYSAETLRPLQDV